jgi:uncharacterized repeat protein (TIGR03803 family)
LLGFGALCLTPAAQAQTETTLYEFLAGSDGGYPTSLIADGRGNFFGTNEVGSGNAVNGTVFELSPSGTGWTLSTIYTFPKTGGPDYPKGLVMDAHGNLFGVTESGGPSLDGTVFALTPDGNGGWTETTLHNFSGPDGRGPTGNLIVDSAGRIYGTTSSGGTCTAQSTGCGVAFELSRNSQGHWTETVLHQFGLVPTDGQIPLGGLVMDSQGNLFGTTSIGGHTGCSTTTCGTVFELTPANGIWTETIVHYFISKDGAFPEASLAIDSAGNLYGTTYQGGAHDAGVVFELSPTRAQGWQIHVVHSFVGFATGEFPLAGVTLGSGGKIYTATEDGGHDGQPCENGFSAQGCGVVYEFVPGSNGQWTSNLIYTFTGGSDGRLLQQTLVVDSSGNLFGVAFAGGVISQGGYGTIFEILP